MAPYFLALGVVLLAGPLIRTGRSRQAYATGGKAPGTTSNAATLLILVALAGMSGYRYGVGTDYWQYSRNYWGLYREPTEGILVANEPGIRWITWISTHIHDSPVTLFAICALVSVGMVMLAVKGMSPSIALSLYLYITMAAWQGSFNAVRQYVAASVFLWGIQFILSRRFLPYATAIFVATLFHLSAAPLLLLYFLPMRRLRFGEVVILGVSGYALLRLFDSAGRLLDGQVLESAYFAESVNPLRAVLALAPLALYFFYTSKTKLEPITSLYTNLAILHALLTITTLGSAYLARTTLYTGLTLIICIPLLINRNDDRANALARISVAAIYFVAWYVETSSNRFLSPFVFIWS